MAHVSAGVVGAGALIALAEVASGSAGIQSWLYLTCLPGVVGMVAGAERLRRRRGRTALVVAASWTGAALGITALVGLNVYSDSAFVAFAALPLLLVPLPAVAAALAATRPVDRWLSG